MMKKWVNLTTLLIISIIIFIGYGLITRCEHVAIYRYCEEENHQFGR